MVRLVKTMPRAWLDRLDPVNRALFDAFRSRWVEAQPGSAASKWAGSDYIEFSRIWRDEVETMVRAIDSYPMFWAAWKSSKLREKMIRTSISRFGDVK